MMTYGNGKQIGSQVAANVLIGRSHIGVHYRMDGVYGALMGETSAVRRLQEVRTIKMTRGGAGMCLVAVGLLST